MHILSKNSPKYHRTPPPPPHAPFPGLYLPPQTWISVLNCIFHIAIAPRILSGELGTCLNSYIVAKADTLFEGRSNCHSGKYLLFHAKQNVCSSFQSTQLLLLGSLKRCCKFHTLRKFISVLCSCWVKTQLHASFPTDTLLLGFSLSLGLVLIEMTHFGSFKMIPS